MSDKKLTPVEIDAGAVQVLEGVVAALEQEAIQLRESVLDYKTIDATRAGQQADVLAGTLKALNIVRQFIKQGWMPIYLNETPVQYNEHGIAVSEEFPTEADQAPYAPGFELLEGGKKD